MPSEQMICGLAGFGIVLVDAEPVLLVQGQDEVDKFFVAGAGAEVAVEGLLGGLLSGAVRRCASIARWSGLMSNRLSFTWAA